MFLEQTSHHPPVSHYYMLGPNNNFKFHGYSNFSSSAGLNSLKLLNKGKRVFEFNDGTTITANHCYVKYQLYNFSITKLFKSDRNILFHFIRKTIIIRLSGLSDMNP